MNWKFDLRYLVRITVSDVGINCRISLRRIINLIRAVGGAARKFTDLLTSFFKKYFIGTFLLEHVL
jgi:hypothetical protein